MGEWTDSRPVILFLDTSFRMVWIPVPPIFNPLYTINSSRLDMLDWILLSYRS